MKYNSENCDHILNIFDRDSSKVLNMLIFYAFFFLNFFAASIEKKSDLPFDDESFEPDENDFNEEPEPTPFVMTKEMEKVIRKYAGKPLTIFDLIKLREIIVIITMIIYIIFFFAGKRSINYYIEKTATITLKRLKTYYAAVSERMTASSLHRYDSFSTGRTLHLGCLTTLRLTRRCDILGYIYDHILLPKYLNYKAKSKKLLSYNLDNTGKSSLTLEVIVDQAQKCPLIFHISEHQPFYADQFKLLQYPLAECESNRLSCYSDFEDCTNIFIPLINEFLEKHPGLISLIEISDANRFELRGECRFVVCVSFNIDGEFQNQAFSDEAVDFVMHLADKYAMLETPKDVFERMQRERNAFLQEQKKELEEKGYIVKDESKDKDKKKKKQ